MILPGCFRQWLQGFEAGSNLFGFRFFSPFSEKNRLDRFQHVFFSLIEDTCCNSKGPLQFDDRHPTAVASSISKAWSPMAPISLNQVWLAMQKIGGVSLIHIIFMFLCEEMCPFSVFLARSCVRKKMELRPLDQNMRIDALKSEQRTRHVEISAGNRTWGWSITCVLDFWATTPFLDHSVQLQITNTGN